MLAIFAVIIGGIVTGRLLVGWRLAFVQRLITFIIWALLFLLGVEVGSDPAVVGCLDAEAETMYAVVRGAEALHVQRTDGKFLPCGESVHARSGIVECGRRAVARVEPCLALFRERSEPTHVVDVLVRDQNTVQVRKRERKRRERLRDAAAGDPRIN